MVDAVTLLLVVVILFLAWKLIGLKRKEDPPGPFSYPFFGHRFLLKRLAKKYGSQHLAYFELSKQYGNVISLRLNNSDVYLVSGNKAIQSVLKNELYDGRPWSEFIRLRNMGKKQGITMNDGAEWKEIRAWAVQTLKEFGFGKQTMSEMIKEEVSLALNDLKGGGVKVIKPVFSHAVMNVLWRFASGTRFCQDSRLEYFVDLMERRGRMFDILGGVLSAFPWIRYIAPQATGYNVLVKLNNELRTFIMETVNEHRAKHVVGGEEDLIDKFLDEMVKTKETSSIYTVDQLVMILVDLFLAGFTTTAITLDFAFLCMAMYPDVQRKLHEEIDAAIPFDRLPDLADKPKLPYAEAVLTETMRMWPVFPVIGPRRVMGDTYLENYKIPKDGTVLMNIYSIFRDPNLYPEPELYKPERFIKNGLFEPDVHSLTFGKGKRRCPGEVLARAATFLLFVGIMQKFELRPVPGVGPTSIEIVSGITVSPKDYKLLVIQRQPKQ
ncbi:putative cytochrome P450 305a1 [Nomia melanderi]|uniref:putative cytochrome P450 305a1 n=1 Tax=Nomia melanderi TaxID=2448451 RepID=UPI0013044758|nr:probable cytochrome P450 305a1 [Nomia melanderi]